MSYLVFGAVPGFFVLRYVFALLAGVPLYLLLRRLYGRPFGVIGVIVVLSSPVLITAWGTDYPDSAVVSYGIAALCCLAMPSERHRRWWLAAAGILLTLAVWAHGVAVLFAAATLVGWFAVRLIRQRTGLVIDVAMLGVIALVVTGVLVAASAVLLAHADFILTTIRAAKYLSNPAQVAMFHSKNWRWVLYDSYLLVPPAVLGVLAVVLGMRRFRVHISVLVVAAGFGAEVVAYAVAQFVGNIQALEIHYFSSTLWSGVVVALAVAIAEICRPLLKRGWLAWLPAAALLAVPLSYEAHRKLPTLDWKWTGLTLAAGMVFVGAAGILLSPRGARSAKASAPVVVTLVVVVLALGSANLALTAAPNRNPPPLPGLVPFGTNPAPAYGTALGTSGELFIDDYRVAYQLDQFVGPASYSGEQLLMWWGGLGHFAQGTWDLLGLWHSGFNSIPSDLGFWAPGDIAFLEARKPGQVLLFSTSSAPCHRGVVELAPFQPTVVRSKWLRSGSVDFYAELVDLGVFSRR